MTLDELLAGSVVVDCRTCQGMSLPGRVPGQPGYCPTCHGAGTVVTSRYALLTDAERVKVLEREVVSLRERLGV